MIPDKKKKKDWLNDHPHNVEEIIKRSAKAVEGYEKYLLDKMNYNELAKIMQELRSVLPISTNPNDKKKKIR